MRHSPRHERYIVTDATVLYYTSNRENETFEQRIREALVSVIGGHRKSALPVISVSQKPVDLGTNICVGDVGACYANEYRQILIGAEAAKTTWIISAEADCLYPPSYFMFDPPNGDLWRYNNVWILWRSPSYASGFRRKRNSEGGQIVRREWLIERLHSVMDGLPKWHSPEFDWRSRVYRQNEWQLFGREDHPIISIKSGLGMRATTQIQHDVEPAESLPFWGNADVLRSEMFG
jgi:hypothetical protein